MDNPKWTIKRWIKRLRLWRLEMRDGNCCSYCRCEFDGSKGRMRTLDHRVPKARGGHNKLSNLCLACATCNNRKGHMSEYEYRGSNILARRRASITQENAA